jgi:hypothetical protein
MSGFIPESTPKLLTRLGIDPDGLVGYGARMLKVFGTAVGAPRALTELCAKRQSRYLWGLRAARRVFPEDKAA